MANKRVFQAQALTVNTVAVGGLARISFDATYRDVIRSRPDGAFGVEDVDRTGLVIGVTIDCTDVVKINQLLASTPGDMTFYAKESGTATFHKYTIVSADAKTVLTGGRLSFPKNADGTLSLSGRLAVTDGTKDLKDVLKVDDAEAAPVLTYPVRLQRPHNASFDPDGADPAIAPIHLESVELSLDAVVIDDYADADVAVTAVDVVGWNPLRTTFSHKDASPSGVVPIGDISGKLMGAVRGVLTVLLLGRGGAANKTLTVNNLLFTGARPEFGDGYGTFGMSGESGWKNGATTYAMNSGTKLFQIA